GHVPGTPSGGAASAVAAIEVDEFGMSSIASYRKSRYGNWQPKASRSCAARVQVQYAATRLDERNVRMPAHHHANVLSARIEVEFPKIVKHVDQHRLGLDNFAAGERVCPSAVVVIAAHGHNRSDRLQRFDHSRLADVASVENQVTATQCMESLWSHQPVRVRDD